MKTLCVLQHVEAEYLGLMEDQFEARNIRFRYVRPFTPGATVPHSAEGFDGLVILGAGPLGVVSGRLVPSLAPELRLAGDFLKRGLPVIGIGFGASVLATACGGGAEAAPLRFSVETAVRIVPDALAGHLPERFPAAIYLRDRPVPPPGAQVLAADGEPLLFQIGNNCFGFVGHPGAKPGMIEDVIMEFDEVPDGAAEGLEAMRAAQAAIRAALDEIMVGLVTLTQLMGPPL
jgi:GMP synthase-like glutamine amidotransferase